MALPVQIRRNERPGQRTGALTRNDFGSVLGRFLGSGLFDDIDDGSPLSGLTGFGVDIREDSDHIYVEADLPGFRKEDVQVLVENGALTITAERREEVDQPAGQQGSQGQAGARGEQGREGQQGQQPGREQGGGQKGNYLLHERRIQRYIRSFMLPPNVDEQNMQAKLENGVLRITLNKREDSKPKRVPVS